MIWHVTNAFYIISYILCYVAWYVTCYVTCYVTRNLPPSPPCGVWIGQPAVPVYSTIAWLLRSHHFRGTQRAMPRFGLGPSAAAAGRSGVRGGGALASTAAAALSFLGGNLAQWCTKPASCAQRAKSYFMQASSWTSSSFSMASLYKTSILASTRGSWVCRKGDTPRKLSR